MNKLLKLHITEKEKENILSLFRIPLTYFSNESNNDSKTEVEFTITEKNNSDPFSSSDNNLISQINNETLQNIDAQPVDQVTERPNIAENPVNTTDSQPTSQQPITQQPTSQQPTSQQPITQQPTSQQPTSQQPTSQQPITQQPTSQQPISQQPTDQQPADQQPISQQPTDQQPTSQQPITQQPTDQQPITTDQQNTAEQPTSSNQQPIANQPASEKNNTSPESSSNTNASLASPSATSNQTPANSKQDNKETSAKKDDKETSEKQDKKDASEKKDDKETSGKQENKEASEKETINSARNMQKKSPDAKNTSSPEKSSSPLDKARDMKKKAVDGVKSKAKDMVPPKALETLGKANALKDQAMGKMAPALNMANKVNSLANGSADDKAEALGDLATKGASAALKASGVGAGVGAAIDVADKVIGNTEIGKKAKTACGYCTVCSCCSSVILLLLPIFLIIIFFSSVWGWIFGLFFPEGEEGTDVEVAITEKTLDELGRHGTTIYEILENTLRDPVYGFQKIKYDENGNILYDENTGLQIFEPLDSVVSFSTNYTYYQLAPQGQFATAYEILISNYTVGMIKEPCHDSGISGEHMPLFQSVLEEPSQGVFFKKYFPTLRKQFDNFNVPDSFFDELKDTLYETIPVYNPSIGTYEKVSLRDLLLETSSTVGDANYDTITVEGILNYTYDEGNVQMAKNFRRLQEQLTRIEVLTYMQSILDFYNQKYQIVQRIEMENSSGTAVANLDYFFPNDYAFFDQFLLIPDIESYMALSSLTATPALAYDIAVASMNALNDTTEPIRTYNDKTYVYFETIKTWAATYTFYNNISDTDGYSLICTDIKSTEVEDALFRRYEITDPESFFNLFEISTGIEISQLHDVTDTNNFFLVGKMLPGATDDDWDTCFPLQERTSITHGYKQAYSEETIKKFGLSHEEHNGIDFSAKIGTPVLAIKAGTVEVPSDVDPTKGWGYYVKVIHDDGYVSYYAHGDGPPTVSNGQHVDAGATIMLSGNSGNSTGPHLHLEVRDPSGATINPVVYINNALNTQPGYVGPSDSDSTSGPTSPLNHTTSIN